MLVEYTTPGGMTERFLFPHPPDQDYPEVKTPKEKVVESLTGRRRIVNYATITTLYQKFSLLPLDFITGELQTFFVSHALKGLEFRYWLDPDDFQNFNTWHLDKRIYKPEKNESTIDRYDIDFTLRRV